MRVMFLKERECCYGLKATDIIHGDPTHHRPRNQQGFYHLPYTFSIHHQRVSLHEHTCNKKHVAKNLVD